jgi:general secretion pathway protein A
MSTPHLNLLGLNRHPFPPTPDAQCYFYTPHLDNELTEVKHCIEAGKGFVLVTGEVGLGKTTFVRRLLDIFESQQTEVALVFNTFLQGRELLAAINHDFGIAPQPSMALDMAALNRFLIERAHTDTLCLLVIDDAQNLSLESLELIRLLCNLESGQKKLLQIVLTGQPELLDMLARNELRQLRSRIVKHVQLKGLSLLEIGRYFDFRITEAGGGGRINLAPAAARLLHKTSGGNPRRIHLLLDRCLYGLVSQRGHTITPGLLKAAIKDVEITFSSALTQRALRSAPGKVPGYVLALLLLAPLLGFAAWSGNAGWPSSVGTLASPPTLPPPSLALPAHPPAPARQETDGLTACMQRLTNTAEGQKGLTEIRTLRLPEHWSGHLSNDESVCLYQTGQEQWVASRPSLKAADLLAGAPNEAVRWLQSRLVVDHAYAAEAIDGKFGPLTREGLAQFQRQQGLPATGEPDDLTLLLLEKSR